MQLIAKIRIRIKKFGHVTCEGLGTTRHSEITQNLEVYVSLYDNSVLFRYVSQRNMATNDRGGGSTLALVRQNIVDAL